MPALGSRHGYYPPASASGGSGLGDPGANGMVARTALNTTTARTITAGTGIVVTNGDGVSGNPTVAVTTALALSLTSQTLSRSGSTVAIDCNNGLVCSLTVDANVTISNPTNAAAGYELTIFVTQDGTGGWWVDFGSAFEKPAVFTLANFSTTLRFKYDGSTWRIITGRVIQRRLGATTADSTGAFVNITNCSFMPAPGGEYRVLLLLSAVSSTVATGTQYTVNPGNIQSGSINGSGRNTGATGIVNVFEALVASTEATALAALSGSTTNGCPARIEMTLKAHATAPTALQARVRTETATTTTVTVQAESVLEITRIA